MPRLRVITTAALMALVLVGCGNGTAVEQATDETAQATTDPTEAAVATTEPTPEPTEAATPEPTPEPTAQSTTFAIGEVVTITQDGEPWADFTVLEVQVATEYPDPDGFYNDTPQNPGFVFLAAKVRYEALANGVDYNPFDFQVFVDGQAVESYAFAINGPKPELSSGTLPQGRTAEGWLLFEVPEAGEVLLSYTGNMFLDEAPVFEIVLRDA